MRRPLAGKIAVVAGATRGAGRGIACALGEAGATVYCTGRSTRQGRAAGATPRPSSPFALADRPETIEETAERVTAAGGTGIAVRVDHTDEDAVRALFTRVRSDYGRLDVLVNDIWGGDELSEWGAPFWELSPAKGRLMLERAVYTHLVTARYGAPLMVEQKSGLIVEVTDGKDDAYRGNLHYHLVKTAAIQLARGMAEELRPHGVAALAVTPGFLRSEAMLEHFGVTEANWRDGATRDPHFIASETPLYVGRGIAALAVDLRVHEKSGRVFGSWDLADEYGIRDADGSRPHWGRYYKKHVRNGEDT
ncbi:MAG: SDR family oxidoreductase [Armatimonadota bacterium]|nr:SDR family oxidoreductase [Armatimonadota bacterium]